MCEPDLEPVAEQASRHTRFKEGRQVDRSYLVLGREATPVGATQWSLREAMSGLEARDAPGHETTEPTAGGFDRWSGRESQIQ